MKPVIDLVPIDDLDRAIVTLAARINAETYELLVLIRQFDERAFANRSPRVVRNAERGVMTITIDLPLETGELVEKALDKARDDSVSGAEFVDESWSARQADALVSMASDYLSGNAKQTRNTSDDYLVTIHVDQSALANGNGWASLPVESVKRLCCDGQAVILGEDENGEPLNIGRKTRTVPTAVKRALMARDRGCAFPGCQHQRIVDAHHIQHWSAGGETRLDNLILLFSRHHKLVHEGGFTIELDYQNRWFFRRPNGQAVPACGYSTQDTMEDEIGEFSKLLNNPPAGGLLSGVKSTVSEPPPPAYWH